MSKTRDFRLTISQQDIKELRQALEDSDTDTSDMTDEEVLQEAFRVLEFGMYGEFQADASFRVRTIGPRTFEDHMIIKRSKAQEGV